MTDIQDTKPENPAFGDMYQDQETKRTYFWNYTTWIECHRVALHTDADALAAVSWLRGQGVTRTTLNGSLQPIGASPAILFQRYPDSTVHLALPGDILLTEQGTGYSVTVVSEQSI